MSLGAALGQYGVSGWDVRHLPFLAGGLGLLVALAPRLLPLGTRRAARGLPVTVLLNPSLTVLSLSHSPPGHQGRASGAMRTNRNLGRIAILALSSAVLNAALGAGTSQLTGYGAAFTLLLAPALLIVLLVGCARGVGPGPGAGDTTTAAGETTATVVTAP